MMKFKVKEKTYWQSIKTMLLYLGYVQESWETDIPIDEKLAQRLREL